MCTEWLWLSPSEYICDALNLVSGLKNTNTPWILGLQDEGWNESNDTEAAINIDGIWKGLNYEMLKKVISIDTQLYTYAMHLNIIQVTDCSTISDEHNKVSNHHRNMPSCWLFTFFFSRKVYLFSSRSLERIFTKEFVDPIAFAEWSWVSCFVLLCTQEFVAKLNVRWCVRVLYSTNNIWEKKNKYNDSKYSIRFQALQSYWSTGRVQNVSWLHPNPPPPPLGNVASPLEPR